MKHVILYGVAGGALIVLLKLIEYQYFIRVYPTEVYGGLLAVIFTAIGIYLGLRWHRAKEVVVVREVRVPAEAGPFVLNQEKLSELGITPREHEILRLIAAGLTNREIGDSLFISAETVKKHTGNIYSKLGARGRTAAVARARALHLLD